MALPTLLGAEGGCVGLGGSPRSPGPAAPHPVAQGSLFWWGGEGCPPRVPWARSALQPLSLCPSPAAQGPSFQGGTQPRGGRHCPVRAASTPMPLSLL